MWLFFCVLLTASLFRYGQVSDGCVLFINGGWCVCYLCGVCYMSHRCAMTLCAFYNLTHSNLTWFTTYTDRWCLSLFLIPPSISLPDIHRSFLSLMSVCWALLCDLHVVCMWMREREMENMYVDSNLHFFVFRILTALWLFISLCLLLRLRLCVSVCVCVF